MNDMHLGKKMQLSCRGSMSEIEYEEGYQRKVLDEKTNLSDDSGDKT